MTGVRSPLFFSFLLYYYVAICRGVRDLRAGRARTRAPRFARAINAQAVDFFFLRVTIPRESKMRARLRRLINDAARDTFPLADETARLPGNRDEIQLRPRDNFSARKFARGRKRAYSLRGNDERYLVIR